MYSSVWISKILYFLFSFSYIHTLLREKAPDDLNFLVVIDSFYFFSFFVLCVVGNIIKVDHLKDVIVYDH